MQSHAVAPDGGPALDDHQGAAGDGGQRGQGLGGGDGRGDGDGVDDEKMRQLQTTLPRLNVFAICLTISEFAFHGSCCNSAIIRISDPSIILQL